MPKYFTTNVESIACTTKHHPSEDGTVAYNDGRVGTAFIQEYRFNKYCLRLQNTLVMCLTKNLNVLQVQRY